ncbi:MAG TPA: hypothetical protein VFU36_10975 [Jatrophihabitans sp.]|nr:hypothetical protein [Jatrophihabitans sp.]
MTTLRIPSRLNGPADSANGGIAAGRLAALVPGDGPVTVTLRLPPPLDRDLTVQRADSGVRLLDAEQLIAEAVPATEPPEPVPPVDFETAAEAATRFAGFTDHPFPTCFGCGTERTDGLACYAGPVQPGEPSYVATPFVPRPDLPRDPALTWAALDCAGGWSIGLAGRRAVLGRMTARIHGVPAVGERCVVVARCDRWDGRKAYSRSTGYGADGRILGVTSAIWIELR